MPERISTLLNVSNSALESKGAFDGFLNIDSSFHVDPALLDNKSIPEFRNAYSEFQSYYNNILALISGSVKNGDKLWKEAHKRLQCKEMASTALGYSKNGTKGKGIGPRLAANILETASQIVKAGIKDPVIFELVGVLEENIGADRISDMTIFVLLPRFAEYSQRVCRELKVTNTRKHFVGNNSYFLPWNKSTNKPVYLIPKKILNFLPIASDWTEIEDVISYNAALRNRVNEIVSKGWKNIAKLTKAELKKLVLANPELLIELLKLYKAKPKTSYDFNKDPLGLVKWASLSENVAADYPLNLTQHQTVTSETIFPIVEKICNQFATLIENNGWHEHLYSNGKLRHERASQLLFYGIAESYCEAYDFDLSREPNAGNGALDFKISKGNKAKVTVEIKYSRNTNLLNGYTAQLPAYNKAEKSNKSIYLIIQTTKAIPTVNRLLRIQAEAQRKGERVPEIIVINGQKQISASKRR